MNSGSDKKVTEFKVHKRFLSMRLNRVRAVRVVIVAIMLCPLSVLIILFGLKKKILKGVAVYRTARWWQ